MHCRRSKQVSIYIADSSPRQALSFNEEQYLILIRRRDNGQGLQKVEDAFARFQIAAGQLANDEGVDANAVGFEQRD